MSSVEFQTIPMNNLEENNHTKGGSNVDADRAKYWKEEAEKKENIKLKNASIDWNIKKHQGDDAYIEKQLLLKEDENYSFQTDINDFLPDDMLDGKYLALGNSVYGVAMGAFLYEPNFNEICDILQLLFFLLIPIIAVGAVQLTALYFLWQDTPAIDEDPTAFCSANGDRKFFLLCIIGIFVTYMIPPLIELSDELIIVRTANVRFEYDNVHDTGKAMVLRLAKRFQWLACLIVLWEAFIWMCVFLDGIIYILTSTGAGDIIQAAVAICFIMDIDNVAVFLYGFAADDNETNRYRCKLPIQEKKTRGAVFMLFTVPVIVTTAAGIVYGLYNTYCS
jgi:hypothetical protein